MLFISSPSMNRGVASGSSFTLFRLLCALIIISVILPLFGLPAQATGPFVEMPWNGNLPLRPPLDVGNYSKPAFADIDNDGDLDVFIGAEDGMVHYYENTGSAAVFAGRTGTANPLDEADAGERSAPFLADLDGDGDLDALIGAKDGMLRYYENTGNADGAVFTERTDTANPLGGVNAGGYSTPFLADMDNDDDLDAFIGADNGRVRYYENTGSADEAVFMERTDMANPLGEVDVGNWSVPFLADMDDDGDFDAFVGAWDDTAAYYENTGSAAEAKFTERTNTANPLGKADVGNDSAPFLADIDKDGDFDAFIGAKDGTAAYYENTGSASEAEFTQRMDTANPLGGVDVGYRSTPFLADINNDGKLDAFIGAEDGRAAYYENTGSAGEAVFSRRMDTANPLGGADAGLYSAPFLTDMDRDGDLDAFIGAKDGTLHYYENMGNADKAVFTERTDMANPLGEVNAGGYSALFLADLDKDGDLDAFIGVEDGTVHYYENTGSTTGTIFTRRTDTSNPLDGVDAGDHSRPFLADLDNDGDLDAFIGAEDGAVRYYENTGNAAEAKFTQRTDMANPLDEVNAESHSTVFLTDMDRDGDLDAFIGAEDGMVRYYENTRSTDGAVFIPGTGAANPLSGADVEDSSAPFLADMDRDNDLDVFIGTGDGRMRYYENTGNAVKAIFTERRDTANSLGKVAAGNNSTPFLADIDNDDDLDAFIGAKDGRVRYYENTENATEADFTQRTGTANPLGRVYVETWSAPFLADIDNDNDLDAFIGAEDGMLRYYENTGNADGAVFTERTDTLNPLGGVDVGDRSVPFLADIDKDGDLDAFIGALDGMAHYYENTGSAAEAKFTKRTEAANPLGGVGVNLNSAPFLADIDNDGDLDAFIGAKDGAVRYYVNTRHHIPADSYAIPAGGNYSRKMQISLHCLYCKEGEEGEKIYYTLDGSTNPASAIEYSAGQPIEISDTATLNFAVVDAAGNYGTIYTETYVIDPIAPVISITSPSGNNTVAGITEIKGTASNTGGSALDRIELQIFSDPLYFKGENKAAFIAELTWLLVSGNTAELRRTGKWTYPIDDSMLPIGSYRITARAFDRAGNMTEAAKIVYKTTQARADLTLEFNPALKSGDTLHLNGRLISRRYPVVDENLEGKSIELYATPELYITPEDDDCKKGPRYIEPKGETKAEGQKKQWHVPDCTYGPIKLTITSDTGNYHFETKADVKGKWFLQTRFVGDDLLTETLSPAKPLLIGQSAGYAVLIQGRALIGDRYEGQEAHNKTVNRIYRTLLERGFERENIFYFNFNPLQDVDGNSIADDIDGIPAKESIAAVFADDPDSPEDLADRIKSSPAPFYLIMVDHGDNEGNFYIDQQGKAEKLTPAEINAWLVSLETALMLPEGTPQEVLAATAAAAQPRLVIMGSCFSGAALSELSLPGRTIITSAAADEESYKGPLEEDGIRGGEYFVDALFHALGRGDNFNEAFSGARERTRLYTRRDSANAAGERTTAVQNPQLNVDGMDMTVMSAAALRLAELELGAGVKLASNFAGAPANICGVTDNVFLQAGEHTVNLRIRVNDARRVQSAPVDVRFPDMDLPSTLPGGVIVPARQLELTGLHRIGSHLQCSQFDHTCETTVTNLNLFKEDGRYELYYFVTDSETGDISPLRRSFVYKAGNCENQDLLCNQPPSEFALHFPKPDAVTRPRVIFVWQGSKDPDEGAVTYTFTIAEDGAFHKVVYQRNDLIWPFTVVDNNALMYNCDKGLSNIRTYYWRVEAIDNFGGRTLSEARAFHTDHTNAPGPPPSCDPVSRKCPDTQPPFNIGARN
ncbi:MAG: hypothetical protein GY862_34810, partial [Gammaproteobacteria bacterium]|nr:hypothetical protein [Gammaproteobacteria bacterium]